MISVIYRYIIMLDSIKSSTKATRLLRVGSASVITRLLLSTRDEAESNAEFFSKNFFALLKTLMNKGIRKSRNQILFMQ